MFCLHVSVHNVCVVPEGRRGHGIPWKGSQVVISAGIKSGTLEEQSGLLIAEPSSLQPQEPVKIQNKGAIQPRQT